jgi:hypothetical protein
MAPKAPTKVAARREKIVAKATLLRAGDVEDQQLRVQGMDGVPTSSAAALGPAPRVEIVPHRHRLSRAGGDGPRVCRRPGRPYSASPPPMPPAIGAQPASGSRPRQ